jgi:hypothetical protein
MTMKNPRDYLGEVQANVKKFQAQGQVTPAENALFGMVDGLAGLLLVATDQIGDLMKRVQALEAIHGRQAGGRQ